MIRKDHSDYRWHTKDNWFFMTVQIFVVFIVQWRMVIRKKSTPNLVAIGWILYRMLVWDGGKLKIWNKRIVLQNLIIDAMRYCKSIFLYWCFNRRQASVAAVNEVLPSSLRVDVNNARNDAELKLIHDGAHPTAMFYITTILVMYLIGLILIFVHYMNSSYGKWNWTLSDAWDELTPSFFNQRYVYYNKFILLNFSFN